MPGSWQAARPSARRLWLALAAAASGTTAVFGLDSTAGEVPFVALEGEGDAARVTVRTSVVVFDRLGSMERPLEEATYQANLPVASKWLLQAMLRVAWDDSYYKTTNFKGETAAAFGDGGGQVERSWKETQPFGRDENPPGQPGTPDRITDHHRTRFDINFKSIKGDEAELYARRMCNAYKSEGKEFLTGMLRAFDLSRMYPAKALKTLTDAAETAVGADINSVIWFTVSIFDSEGNYDASKSTTWGCGNDPPKGGTAEGMFALPDCPPRAMRCNNPQAPADFCSDVERKQPDLCKCAYGYEGDIELSTDTRYSTGYKGTCEPKPNYCRTDFFPEGELELVAAGGASQGFLDEKVRMKCPQGFTASKTTTCRAKDAEQGFWDDVVFCSYNKPQTPAAPTCANPQLEDKTLKATGCDNCASLEACGGCSLTCKPGYQNTTALDQAKCMREEVECPTDPEILAICKTDRFDARLVSPWCCDEPWSQGQAVPPPAAMTKVEKCSDVLRTDECYRSCQDVDGGDCQGCCWEQGGWSLKAGATERPKCALASEIQDGDSIDRGLSCAKDRKVWRGVWEGLPTCAKRCEPPSQTMQDQALVTVVGCDNCLPGQDCESECTITCRTGTEHLGGGATGTKRCSQEEGQELTCTLPADETDTFQHNCVDTKIGDTCNVECKQNLGPSVEGERDGARTCKKKARELTTVDTCEDITDEAACLKSVVGEKGCCWRAAGFRGDGKAKCLAMGSPEIKMGNLPENFLGGVSSPIVGCTTTHEAAFDIPQAPKCKELCDAPPSTRYIEVLEACKRCVVDEPCDGCEMSCNTGPGGGGPVRFGGGPEGKYSCKTINGKAAFETGPQCRPPLEGERHNFILGGDAEPQEPLPAIRPICEAIDAEGLHLDPISCTNCRAQDDKSDDGCKSCVTPCMIGYSSAEDTSVVKKCTVTRNTLQRKTSCVDLDTQEACLAADTDKGPCCWRSAERGGLTAAGGQCQAGGDKDMVNLPEACAPEFKGQWDAFPTCHKLCLRSAKWDMGRLMDLFGVVVPETCRECTVGSCDCEVKCKETHRRIGGGQVGPRSCSEDSLQLEEPPLCALPRPTPTCAAAAQPNGNEGSLTFCPAEEPNCDQKKTCTAGDAGCSLHARCSAGFALKSGTEGPKQCTAKAVGTQGKCEELADKGQCMTHQEGENPCVWKEGGFKQADDSLSPPCLPLGDTRVTSGPESVAVLEVAEWEDFPQCGPVCTGLELFPFVEAVSGCEACFADGASACDCQVKCAEGYAMSGGSKTKAVQCGTDGKFTGVPVCTPESFANFKQYCPAIDSIAGLKITSSAAGCKCTNENKLGSDAPCDCEVACDDANYKLVGGTAGAKTCVRGENVCPPDATLANDACTSASTPPGTEIDPACCAEGREGKGVEAFPRLFKAVWEDPPRCERKCDNVFKGAELAATGCDSCVPSDTDCQCKVGCAQGKIFYGGVATGAVRSCAKENGFACFTPSTEPVCGEQIDYQKACDVPSSGSLTVQGCGEGCYVKNGVPSDACTCSMQCKPGFGVADGESAVTASCQKVTKDLNVVSSCVGLGASACLGSKDTKNRHCCLQPVHGCAALGAPEMLEVPKQCAVDWTPVLEPPPPKCLPKCDNSLKKEGVKTTGCDNCLWGVGKTCKCTVECDAGYEYVGGAKIGERNCDPVAGGGRYDFGEAPMCQKIPEPLKCPSAELDVTVKHLTHTGCLACAPDQPCDGCEVKCAPGFAASATGAAVGNKKCRSIPMPNGKTLCQVRGSAPDCLANKGTDWKLCCWQETLFGGICDIKGSGRFSSGKEVTCTQEKASEWESLPTCVKVVVFADAIAKQSAWFKNLNVPEACYNCPSDQPSCPDCKITCKPGTVRSGNAEENVPLENKNGFWTRVPICIAEEAAPQCAWPETALTTRGRAGEAPFAGFIVAGGCGGAALGSKDCRASCAAGYQNYQGTGDALTALGDNPETALTCVETQWPENPKSGMCHLQTTSGACLSTKEDEQPCCWSEGLMTREFKCSRFGSTANMVAPDLDALGQPMCTRKRGAQWTGWQQCLATCTNEEFKVKSYDSARAETCNCRVGDPNCKCSVGCAQGFIATPTSPPPGARTCSLEPWTNTPQWQPAKAVCEEACEKPSNRSNTLVIQGCENCAPGTICERCKVTCREGTELQGSASFQCGADKKWRLPECSPKCQVPDDQQGSLDTSQCLPCTAKSTLDGSCRCTLNCAITATKSGGAEGKFGCEAENGVGNWKSSAGGNDDGVPVCSPAFTVFVKESDHKQPLIGAKVTLYADRARTNLQMGPIPTERAAGDLDGSAKFVTPLNQMTVFVEYDGYGSRSSTISRAQICPPGMPCDYHVTLAKNSAKGMTFQRHDKDCFIEATAPGKYDIKVVLEWGDGKVIKDLDLWGRSWDCGVDAEMRYDCGIGQESITSKWWVGIPSPQCRRQDFVDFNGAEDISYSDPQPFKVSESRYEGVMLSETQACTSRLAWWKGRVDPDGVVDNQFPKWVTSFSRSLTDMDKRLLAKSKFRGEPRRRRTMLGLFAEKMSKAEESFVEVGEQPRAQAIFPNWPSHFMELNVDHNKGFGPETITLDQVPPGRYQFVVSKWSGEEVSISSDKQAKVMIQINTAQFKCAIPEDTCKVKSRLWNVANLVISPGTEDQTGKHRYKVKILDNRRSMAPINHNTIPGAMMDGDAVVNLAGRGTGYWSYGDWNAHTDYQYWKLPAVVDGFTNNRNIVEQICYGSCVPEKGMDGSDSEKSLMAMDRCLDRDFLEEEQLQGNDVYRFKFPGYPNIDGWPAIASLTDTVNGNINVRISNTWLAGADSVGQFQIKLKDKNGVTKLRVTADFSTLKVTVDCLVGSNEKSFHLDDWPFTYKTGEENNAVILVKLYRYPQFGVFGDLKYWFTKSSRYPEVHFQGRGYYFEGCSVAHEIVQVETAGLTLPDVMVQRMDFLVEDQRAGAVKSCSTRCATSECPKGGYGKIYSSSVPLRINAGYYSSMSPNMYVRDSSGFCWDQKLVGPEFECCNGF